MKPTDPASRSVTGPALNAHGARLNRRGLETRARVIGTAIGMLADGEHGGEVSANLVAKRAGVTWGTLQHQFGDVDGLWAAVLEELGSRGDMLPWQDIDDGSVAERMSRIVDALWSGLDSTPGRAVAALRSLLLRSTAEFTETYPRTAEQLNRWDRRWRRAYARAFRGLVVDAYRLERVRHLLPAAVHGLYLEQHLSTYTDIDDARAVLAESIAGYLNHRD
ncbi:TetR/AcrR family transcriptional regulator [Actinomadura sp. BRA 177]|uniref:TetR/AcrR family transcriptional regulator n=1 Tax=Actinomadura sp. BRA 177 TaxID=2745202 RepID=UPI00159602AC|nr:TetR/AcrR family transcriptional regulator [Actinomadura sp. BRA 177]NVI86272.1 TetR/AcrR family transcriptional regulator [Actinomadura sp. BRA 177]